MSKASGGWFKKPTPVFLRSVSSCRILFVYEEQTGDTNQDAHNFVPGQGFMKE